MMRETMPGLQDVYPFLKRCWPSAVRGVSRFSKSIEIDEKSQCSIAFMPMNNSMKLMTLSANCCNLGSARPY